MANEWKEWFEVETNPQDPTQITMRRLTEEEAKKAYADQLMRQIQNLFPQAFVAIQDNLTGLADELNQIIDKYDLKIDQKAIDRKRSRDDVRNKRKELRRNK